MQMRWLSYGRGRPLCLCPLVADCCSIKKNFNVFQHLANNCLTISLFITHFMSFPLLFIAEVMLAKSGNTY